ncbi:MAG: helix-turn-helix domain-containing protein [Pseudomonadota bacterium]
MQSLGARIKELRLRAGLNKAELARRIGVSDVTISYWESGAIKQIGHERLVALADALTCSLSTLLEGNSQSALPLLNHTGDLPWEQMNANPIDASDGSLPVRMPWQAPAFIATPGVSTHFPPLKTGDLALLGPTREFQQPGHYLVSAGEQREMKYLDAIPDGEFNLHAILLCHWRVS